MAQGNPPHGTPSDATRPNAPSNPAPSAAGSSNGATDSSVTFTPGASTTPAQAATPPVAAVTLPTPAAAPTDQPVGASAPGVGTAPISISPGPLPAVPVQQTAPGGQGAAGAPIPGHGTGAGAPSGPATTPASGDAPGRAPIEAGRTEEGLGTSATASPAPALLGDQTIGTTDVSQRHLTPTPPGASGAPTGPPAGGASALVAGPSPGSAAMTPSVAAADASAAARAQPAPMPPTPADQPTTAAGAPADAGARAAALIRDQMPILVTRILYDTQELVRVGAIGPDVVTIRQVLESLAAALERGDPATFGYSYSRAARPNIPQINDQTLPYHLGLQISGMFEAILRDTFNQGFAGDPALRGASVTLLAQMSGPAKRALLGEPRALVQWQAPLI